MATVNYSWTLPTVGASVNTWGTLLNTIIDDIDAKMVSKTATQTLTNKTLTSPVINGFTGDTSAINIGSGQLVKDTSGNLGLGATPQSGGGAARWVTAGSDAGSTYSGGFISAVGSTAKGYVYYDNAGSVNTFVMQAAAGVSLGFRANAANVNQMTLDTSGNLLVGTTSGTEHTLQKSAASGYAATISNTNSSNGYVLQLKSSATLGTSWNLIDGFANGVGVFRVSGNGDVANYNNSYGSISSKEYKVNIVDTTPKLAKLLKYRVVNYSLKDDPGQLKQIGLIWEELYEISPGLCEETPEFADVEIEPARTEIKVTQRQKTRTEESTRYEVLLVDGQWTKLPVRTEVQVPLFDLHPLFEQDGSPVMEVAEPAIEASPALYDKDGNEVTPAVKAKPAVMRQVMFQVPVMEDVEETVEIPAKTESRPTGKTIKSVKYSVLVPMLVKAMQEQQAQIEELKAKVGA